MQLQLVSAQFLIRAEMVFFVNLNQLVITVKPCHIHMHIPEMYHCYYLKPKEKDS